jgi:hypothetical protein
MKVRASVYIHFGKYFRCGNSISTDVVHQPSVEYLRLSQERQGKSTTGSRFSTGWSGRGIEALKSVNELYFGDTIRQGWFDIYIRFAKYTLLRKYYSLRLQSTAFRLKVIHQPSAEYLRRGLRVFCLRAQDSRFSGNDKW